MPTCGNCRRRSQTLEQIRACYESARVPGEQGSKRPTASTYRTGRAQRATTTGLSKAKPKQPKKLPKQTASAATSRATGKKSRSEGCGMAWGRTGAESQPAGNRTTEEELRERYPSGATKEPATEPSKSRRSPQSGNRDRGGANFRDGLVNPPPTGGIAKSDY